MADEASPQPAATPDRESLFSKKNIIILVIITTILAGSAIFGLMFFLKAEDSGSPTGTKTIKEAREMKAPGIIVDFDTMVVNIAGTRGLRYLKVTVSVELDSADMPTFQSEFSGRKVQMVDMLNGVFSSKNLETVTTPELRDNIKREIRDQFNQVLTTGQVLNVYFKDFVVQ